MKPLIGIPARRAESEYGPRYAVLATYPRAVEMAGGAPIVIPLALADETLRAIFERMDGLLLAGGVDVHPREYGEEVTELCGEIDPARDVLELMVTRWALAEKMPILGICRGIQMLNVAAGGTLYQDVHHQLETQVYHQHRKGEPFNKLAHWIDIAPESQLARALGATRVEVNSLHHQAVKDVAPNLRVIARAPDGVIEGMEATNGHFVLAVQFHPEWLLDDDARMVRIFEEFVRASK